MLSIAKFAQNPVSRLLLFIFGLLLLWVPTTLAWFLGTGWRPGIAFDKLASYQLLGASIFLYIAIVSVLWWIAHRLDGGTLAQFGLVWDWKNLGLLLVGLGFGWVSLALLFSAELVFGWLSWKPEGLAHFGQFFFEGLLVGLAVAVVEELLFRGFIVHSIERQYGVTVAWIGSALFFGVTHFIKAPEVIVATWPQFPGLVVMGLVLAFARAKGGGRLGMCVGLHGGWVWSYYVINTLNLVAYNRPGIPQWLTGINGNPLAGLAGVVFLLVTAMAIAQIPVSKASTLETNL
ncbi:MAG: CPBP family intramembrane metalloprotease [Anaerolineae bacterium]|nr:CPBP family intramembrane metalloprotease [Gloeobacterales cyanobacterium ES-bin-313]